jgi:8-oxo-dGTP pyrophosphatase MutT (NUDIX family)
MSLPKSIAGLIFSSDRSAVLLVQRRDVPVWVLPGGGIDPNETPENAVIREILEETGFTVKVDRLVGDYIPINRLTKQTYLYECTILSGHPTESLETKRVCFFPLSDLPKRIPPPYKEWIADGRVIHPPIQKKLTSITYLGLLKHLFIHPILIIRHFLSRLGLPINT